MDLTLFHWRDKHNLRGFLSSVDRASLRQWRHHKWKGRHRWDRRRSWFRSWVKSTWGSRVCWGHVSTLMDYLLYFTLITNTRSYSLLHSTWLNEYWINYRPSLSDVLCGEVESSGPKMIILSVNWQPAPVRPPAHEYKWRRGRVSERPKETTVSPKHGGDPGQLSELSGSVVNAGLKMIFDCVCWHSPTWSLSHQIQSWTNQVLEPGIWWCPTPQIKGQKLSLIMYKIRSRRVLLYKTKTLIVLHETTEQNRAEFPPIHTAAVRFIQLLLIKSVNWLIKKLNHGENKLCVYELQKHQQRRLWSLLHENNLGGFHHQTYERSSQQMSCWVNHSWWIVQGRRLKVNDSMPCYAFFSGSSCRKMVEP